MLSTKVRVKVRRAAVVPGLDSDWTRVGKLFDLWAAKGSKMKTRDGAATDGWSGPLTRLVKEKKILLEYGANINSNVY